MKSLTRTLAAALALVSLAACREAGGDLASLPEPEPGDPSFFAPDGWPLQVDDRISYRRQENIHSQFPSFGGAHGLHTADGIVYAAHYRYAEGTMDDETEPRHILVNSHLVYEGHFPKEFPASLRRFEDNLPGHLRGSLVYYSVPPKHPHRKDRAPESSFVDLGAPVVVGPDGRPIERKKH